jgi:hypothetical protein
MQPPISVVEEVAAEVTVMRLVMEALPQMLVMADWVDQA